MEEHGENANLPPKGSKVPKPPSRFGQLKHRQVGASFLFKFGARACFLRTSPAGVIAPGGPSITRPDTLLDTQLLAAAEAGVQLVEGIRSLTWFPLDRQMELWGELEMCSSLVVSWLWGAVERLYKSSSCSKTELGRKTCELRKSLWL